MKHLYLGITTIVLVSGCVGTSPMTEIEPGPWGSGIESFRPAAVTSADRTPDGPALDKDELKLAEAVALALKNSPALSAQAWEAEAANARVLQARARSNPELEIEAEELGADGSADEALVSAALGTDLDVWGARGKRAEAARLGSALAETEYEAVRLAVLSGTSKAFAVLLASQEQVLLSEEQVRLSQEVHRITVRRVDAGTLPKLEQTKAQVSLATSELDLERAKKNLENSRQRLSALWGTSEPTFKVAVGDLGSILEAIPDFDDLVKHLVKNPEHVRSRQELELQKANLSIEKVGRLPAISASARIETSRASSETTLGVGLGVSLPIFDRNHGSIAEAKAALARSGHEHRAARVALELELAETHRTACLAVGQVSALKEKALPAARQAFDGARAGYQKGKFSLLDVLDAQATFFDTQGRYIDALVEYHTAVADLQRLIGRRLDTIDVDASRK